MEHFANWFANTLDPKRKASFSDLRIETTAEVDENNQNRNNHKQQSNGNGNVKVWTPVPETYRKTFYYDGEKISMPIARALRSRGWTRVDTPEYAHLIYTYSSAPQLATALFPWQRFNYIPHIEKWNRKADFVYYYKQYYHRQQRRAQQQQQAQSSSSSTGTSTKTSTNVNRRMSMYVPESYMLNHNEKEILDFQRVLWDGEEDANDEPTTTTAGKHYPWVHKLSSVNQGKGITILPPNSDALLRLPATSLQALRKNMKVEQKNDNSEEENHDAAAAAAAATDDDDDTNTRQQRRRRRKSSSNSNDDDETDDDDYTRSTEDEDENEESIIQRYICNEMTWTNQRKFDVRMYWFVASLDPLIVYVVITITIAIAVHSIIIMSCSTNNNNIITL